jgi:hypothetical protein
MLVAQGQAAPAIHHAIQLEQWLMEGAYNKVGHAQHRDWKQDLSAALDRTAQSLVHYTAQQTGQPGHSVQGATDQLVHHPAKPCQYVTTSFM